MNFSQTLLASEYWGWLWDGWLVTMASSLLVIAASTLLGLGFAAARESGLMPLRAAAVVYLSVFRNTPLLVQLFFWYFGVPSLLPAQWVSWLNTSHHLGPLGWPSFEFVSAIIGLTLYSTAYVGEEIRAGLHSVPRSQVQAALSLGMTRAQALRHVVLPQALAKIVSPLAGQYMNIVKNTSLGMTIGLVELSYRARQAEAVTFQSFQVYGIATLMYIALIALLDVASQRIQKRRPWGRVNVRRA